MKRVLTHILLCTILCGLSYWVQAQTVSDVIADIYEQLSEEGTTAEFEDLSQELQELHSQKINVNTATIEDLQKLRFLSDLQMDAILLYVDKHPMESLYELQLIPSLRDYEIRNLSYFLTVGKATSSTPLYAKEVFHQAKQELTLRVDARNIEDNANDPWFGHVRYRFNYHNQVQAGLTLQRGTGQAWKDISYGGYVQLSGVVPHLQTLVLGNFQAQFGQGLVLGQPVHMGKSTYLLSAANGGEGVKKYASVSSSYDYLHGVAATGAFGPVNVSVLYSLRQETSSWHHAIGGNVTYHHKRFKVGLSALGNIYHRDSTQIVFGANARYNRGRWDIWGEVAASHDAAMVRPSNQDKWGWGCVVGSRLTPIDGLGLLLLYRYYAPTFENRYAYCFSETSKVNDENGFYIGTEIRLVPKWRFSLYADGFAFAGTKYGIPYPSGGYDAMFQMDYEPTAEMNMFWKLRARRKAMKDLYSLRYQYTWAAGGWRLRTQLDGNIAKDTGRPTWGISVWQDIEYAFRQVPIVLQLRLQGFDIRDWDNRVYAYENDVLYAFSIPATYGRGGRCYLNMRYHVCDHLSLYLRASETVYHPDWKSAHATRTDVHLLLRVVW